MPTTPASRRELSRPLITTLSSSTATKCLPRTKYWPRTKPTGRLLVSKCVFINRSSSCSLTTFRLRINNTMGHLSKCREPTSTWFKWVTPIPTCFRCLTRPSTRLVACHRVQQTCFHIRWTHRPFTVLTGWHQIWVQKWEARRLALECLQGLLLKWPKIRLSKWFKDKACREELHLRLAVEDWLVATMHQELWTMLSPLIINNLWTNWPI